MSARWAAACAAVLISTTPMMGRCQRARLHGQVFDSVAAMPLAGARVELVNAADRARIMFSVVSDSLGRFVVDGVERGRYIAGFLHPMLDSLGLALAQRPLEVNADGEVSFDLAVPSPGRIEGALCGPSVDKANDGVILGYVLNSHSLTATEGASVIAQWDEISLGGGGIDRKLVTRRSTSDGSGWFSLCGVPTQTTVAVRAAVGPDTSGPIEIDVPKTHIARRNLYVDHRTGAETRSPSTQVNDTATGTATILRGWVRTEDGVPVPGAQIAIVGSSASAATNTDGEFQLTGMHGGTQTLVTHAIGFLPDERAVDLTDQRLPVIVGLTSLRRFLDTVHVRSEHTSLTSAVGFDDRRKLGAGRFFTADDIERMHPHELTDILRHASTLDMHTDNQHNITIRMRGDMQSCTPAIFVDGKQFVNWELNDLNGIVQPDQIAGLEIYTPSLTPAEFRTKRACGTIVVWTRATERRR